MEQYLRIGIFTMLRRTSPDRILAQICGNTSDTQTEFLCRLPDEREFCQAILRENPQFSLDDARNAYYAFTKALGRQDSCYGIFYLLYWVVKDVFKMDKNEECLCRHENLLDYWNLAHPIGSPLFVAAYHAWYDSNHPAHPRRHFSMSPTVRADNYQLNAILANKMAENHFHIGGSSHAFLFSWICMMNHVVGRKRGFIYAGVDREPLDNIHAGYGEHSSSFRTLVFKAAYIRAFLFMALKGSPLVMGEGELSPREKKLRSREQLRCILEAKDDIELYSIPFQRALDSIGHIYGFKGNLDYAISQPMDAGEAGDVYFQLSGEFGMLYHLFYQIYSGNEEIREYSDYIYLYLTIWTQFRSELIQTNRRVGFGNFKQYQDRKDAFTFEYPAYQRERNWVALHCVLDDPRIASFEIRFMPQRTLHKLLQRLREYEMLSQPTAKTSAHLDILRYEEIVQGARALLESRPGLQEREAMERAAMALAHGRIVGGRTVTGLENKRDPRLHFVVHFAKKPQRETDEHQATIWPRDHRLRHSLYSLSAHLLKLRARHPKAARALTGIDACSNEVGCRPEVFAVVMRRLREHTVMDHSYLGQRCVLHKLRITYHVGEDFHDPLDGLRAIDEAIRFLELSQGDRLGHALALGIDIEKWYQRKNYRILLPGHDLLDNVVWLYAKMQYYGLETHAVEDELRALFYHQFVRIYRANLPFSEKDHTIDMTTYHLSWTLRGDAPELYKAYPDHTKMERTIQNAEPYQLSKDSSMGGANCANLQACSLYHHYHYHPKIKIIGAEVVEHQVSRKMVQAIAQVQQCQQREISRRNIGIECNPTSNYLIGSFKRFEEHPILRFNDAGLYDSPDNPRLHVSINTDDMGVFDTCLENEYAIMACALEKANEYAQPEDFIAPQRIYTWLDSIRRMGLEQSFLLSNDGYSNSQ